MKDSTKNYILIGMVVLLGIAACVHMQNQDPAGIVWSSIPMIGVAIFLIPITALIAFSVLIYQLLRLRNARIMAMISKGIYEHKPWNWKLILLLVGVLLLFIAPGAALLMTAEESLLKGIGLGILLFFIGIGILVFRQLAYRYLPPLDDQNQ
jgi:protein-S-isoprenylcysteine O-methyltransferase Ste14